MVYKCERSGVRTSY